MGKIAIAIFRPKPGKTDELKQVIADRSPLLRQLGLATDRVNITMASSDGHILDVSEWVDDDAIARAHETPEVLQMWERFSACSDFAMLNELSEIKEMFPNFEPVELPTAQT